MLLKVLAPAAGLLVSWAASRTQEKSNSNKTKLRDFDSTGLPPKFPFLPRLNIRAPAGWLPILMTAENDTRKSVSHNTESRLL
ncbi:MAG: hypothetical protein JOZ14_08275 [Acidobacteria bacterium]|nr:hypothetical protein [Acidobacteriota bacterium]